MAQSTRPPAYHVSPNGEIAQGDDGILEYPSGKRCTPILALVCAATFAGFLLISMFYAPDAGVGPVDLECEVMEMEETEGATEDATVDRMRHKHHKHHKQEKPNLPPAYFTLDKMETQHPAPKEASASARRSSHSSERPAAIGDLDPVMLLKMGKELYDVFMNGKPVLNIDVDTTSVLPKSHKVGRWSDLNSWIPQTYGPFEYKTRNRWKSDVAHFRWNFIWNAHGQSYDESLPGWYLGQLTLAISYAYVSWGWGLEVSVTTGDPINIGTVAHPIAGMSITVKVKTSSPLEAVIQTCTVQVAADGSADAYACRDEYPRVGSPQIDDGKDWTVVYSSKNDNICKDCPMPKPHEKIVDVNYYDLEGVTIYGPEDLGPSTAAVVEAPRPYIRAPTLVGNKATLVGNKAVVGALIIAGSALISLIINNQADATLKNHHFSVVPKDLEGKWGQMEGWRPRMWDGFSIETKNYLGYQSSVVKFGFAWNANGSHKGVGSYISSATILIDEVSTIWGYSVSAEAEASQAFNVGAADDPIAAVRLRIVFKVETMISSERFVCLVLLKGTGEGEKLDCNLNVQQQKDSAIHAA